MAEEEETGEKAAAAVKRIYELCDVWHKQNRVPMVCGGKWDVLTPLVKCLQQENDGLRHLACLALNNLSIPTENKGVMALGPVSGDVIGGLCRVIQEDKQESYFCCICLMNLSFPVLSLRDQPLSLLLRMPIHCYVYWRSCWRPLLLLQQKVVVARLRESVGPVDLSRI